MVNLIKYEFIRKSRILGISLAVVFILNAIILIKLQLGVYSADEQLVALGAFFTVLLGVFFVLYIVNVIMMYSRDLDHKTGYMFLLTPNSGYKILGAKVLTGILEGFLFLVIYALLLAVNFLGFYGEPLRALIGSDFFSYMINHIHLEGINLASYSAAGLFTIFVGVVNLILMVFAAISIRKSILAEKKFGGFISFIIFLILGWINSTIVDTFSGILFHTGVYAQGVPDYPILAAHITIQAVLGIVFFLVSAYLLDKRMDI